MLKENFNSGNLLNLKTGLLEDFMGKDKYYFWINQANKFDITNLNLHPAGFSIEAAKSILENFHSHVDKFKTKFERITVENFSFFVNHAALTDGLFQVYTSVPRSGDKFGYICLI